MGQSFLRSSAVAARLGLTTATLKKWRTLGKGPRGAFHVGRTTVLYPVDSVDEFIREMKAQARPPDPRSRGA